MCNHDCETSAFKVSSLLKLLSRMHGLSAVVSLLLPVHSHTWSQDALQMAG